MTCTYQVLDRLDAPAHAPHIVEPHHPVLHVEQRVRAAQRFLRLRVLNVTLKQRRYLKTFQYYYYLSSKVLEVNVPDP